MKTTTLQLLPNTAHGTPSGNYDGSSLDFNGTRQQAANYYGAFGGLQTVAFYLNGFQGRIRIEATLESDPTENSDWFRVYDVDYTDSTAATTNFSTNITGNFVWIRARVEEFTAGTISRVMISY
jgi:hypothetical protein